MKEKSLYDKGYDTGYLLGKTAPHVIDIAMKELQLPDEFLSGLRKGKRDGQRERRVEEHQKSVAEDRAYMQSIYKEEKKQKDYDALPAEKKILRSNRKKAEEEKHRQSEQTKELITSPENVALRHWVTNKEESLKKEEVQAHEQEITAKEESTTLAPDGSATQNAPGQLRGEVSKEEARMIHLEALREDNELNKGIELQR